MTTITISLTFYWIFNLLGLLWLIRRPERSLYGIALFIVCNSIMLAFVPYASTAHRLSGIQISYFPLVTTFIGVLLATGFRFPEKYRTPRLLAILFMIVVGIQSFFVATNYFSSAVYGAAWLINLASIFLFARFVQEKGENEVFSFIKVFLWCMLLMAFVGFFRLYIGTNKADVNPFALMNRNGVVHVVNFAFPLCFFLYDIKKISKVAHYLMLVVFAFLIIMMWSRTGILVAFCSTLLYCCLTWQTPLSEKFGIRQVFLRMTTFLLVWGAVFLSVSILFPKNSDSLVGRFGNISRVVRTFFFAEFQPQSIAIKKPEQKIPSAPADQDISEPQNTQQDRATGLSEMPQRMSDTQIATVETTSPNETGTGTPLPDDFAVVTEPSNDFIMQKKTGTARDFATKDAFPKVNDSQHVPPAKAIEKKQVDVPRSIPSFSNKLTDQDTPKESDQIEQVSEIVQMAETTPKVKASRKKADYSGPYIEKGLDYKRLSYMRASVNLIRKHWLLGMGFGLENYKNALEDVENYKARSRSHCFYLSAFAEFGIVGYTLILSLFVSLCYQLDKARRNVKLSNDSIRLCIAAIEASAIIFFLSLFCHEYTTLPTTWFFIGIGLGLGLLEKNDCRLNTENAR